MATEQLTLETAGRGETGTTDNGSPAVVDGWTIYRQHASRRLQAIAERCGDKQPWIDDPAMGTSTATVPRTLASIHCSPNELDDAVADGASAGLNPSFADVLEEEPSDTAGDELPDELPDECLVALRAATHSEAGEPVTAPLARRLLGSYGLSILAHAAILILLGTITYQPPSEGSSLGSQVLSAAEATETELVSEVEMLAPAELNVNDALASSSEVAAVASDLSQLSASMSQSMSSMAVEVDASSSTSSSIATALSAPTSGTTASSRGSGMPSMNGSFFGVGTGGNYFCYVVDRSGSMRGGAWESAKAELLRSLKSLKPSQRFYIIFFADEFEAIPEPGRDVPAEKCLYATPENIDHARRWIQSVELNRGGPPTEALAWAIEREPDAIYLLTDGVTKVDVCAQVRRINRIEDVVNDSLVRVPIHAIAYFSLDGQQLMRQLAKENEGQFIYVPKPKAKK